MGVALYLIALALVGAGAASIAYGYGIILNERGWTMVISGAVAATGGFVLLGIAVVAGRVKRVERALARVAETAAEVRPSFPPMPSAPPVPPPPSRAEAASPAPRPARPEPEEHAVLKAADAIPEPAPLPRSTAAPAAAAPPREADSRTIIGTYNSGGNSYVMYSDGSIEADTPSGQYTFQSLDELKEFIAAGGEQPARGA